MAKPNEVAFCGDYGFVCGWIPIPYLQIGSTQDFGAGETEIYASEVGIAVESRRLRLHPKATQSFSPDF